MIRSFFVDFVFPVLLFLVVRSLIGGVFRAPARKAQQGPTAKPPVSAGGELRKDPVCGTYVSDTASVKRTVHGDVLHFCSKECAERYTAAIKRRA
jgi:YHS domain-containing protein